MRDEIREMRDEIREKKNSSSDERIGLPGLLKVLKEQMKREHVMRPNNDICISTGSQDVLSKTFDMLLDEEDVLITENPTYR